MKDYFRQYFWLPFIPIFGVFLAFVLLARSTPAYKNVPVNQKEALSAKPTPPPSVAVGKITKESSAATLGLTAQNPRPRVGQEVTQEIKLKGNNLTLSAIAVRFSYKYENEVPFKPVGDKMKVNTDLLQNDWVFLVNRLIVDEVNKMVIGELAAINILPSGYFLQNDLTLATFKLDVVLPANVTFSFDPAETKVLTKSNQEIPVQMVKLSYNFN